MRLTPGDPVGSSRIYSRLTKTEPFAGYGLPVMEQPVDPEAASAWASAWLPEVFSQTVGFASGVWSAPLPQGIPDAAANNYSSGILPEPPIDEWEPVDPADFGPEMLERITSSLECSESDLVVVQKMSLVLFAAQWVSEYLSSTPNGVALVREMNTVTADAECVWSTVMGPFYAVAGPRDRESIADLLDHAASVSGELIILTSTDELDPAESQRLEGSDLGALVGRASQVILGAYDGEGYIRWSRSATG